MSAKFTNDEMERISWPCAGRASMIRLGREIGIVSDCLGSFSDRILATGDCESNETLRSVIHSKNSSGPIAVTTGWRFFTH